uniref:hypothetical protein n=1 Tax=Gracilaria hainanensis TaxID=2871843 RepID=UPI002E79A6AC|nr:hypothetical protein V2792_mgp01 [Gracilaria hainanensis]WQB61713.1 hypothetical protein [Gracilaria hainanensis]
MNQFRLNNQFNFVEIFDSLDNNFLKNTGFLIFKNLDCFQVFYKFERLSRVIFMNYLLLECLTSRKIWLPYEQNLKKQKFLFLKATIRGNQIFLFLEILLHSMFLISKPIINWYKLKIEHFNFFLSNVILNKLLMNALIQNNFMIYTE